MKLLFNFISWAIVQGILALICTLVYNFMLIDLLKVEIEYVHWLGIIIIATCIMPSGKILKPNSVDNDTDKFSNYVNSLIKKK